MDFQQLRDEKLLERFFEEVVNQRRLIESQMWDNDYQGQYNEDNPPDVDNGDIIQYTLESFSEADRDRLKELIEDRQVDTFHGCFD